MSSRSPMRRRAAHKPSPFMLHHQSGSKPCELLPLSNFATNEETLRHRYRNASLWARQSAHPPSALHIRGYCLQSSTGRNCRKGGWGFPQPRDVALPPFRHKAGIWSRTTSVEITQTRCITLLGRSLAVGLDLTGHTEARAVRATLVASSVNSFCTSFW